MSVAELTINCVAKPYIVGRQASREVLGRIGRVEFGIFPRKHKAVLAFLALSFILAVSLYLYLAAEIVALGLRERDLKEKQNYALIKSGDQESALVKSTYSKNSDFFAERGYIMPINIEVIRRSLNVVEIQQNRNIF